MKTKAKQVLSLTDFVDIVAKAGRPKATKVWQVKRRPEYEPAFDFYKPLREHLIEMHRSGGSRSQVRELLYGLVDPKKAKTYPELLNAYSQWWGRKDIKWFEPPRDIYSAMGFDIAINPELGLSINGHRYVVKLYLKSDPLSAVKVEVINDLLEFQLRRQARSDDSFGVLEVREAKLYVASGKAKESLPVVNAELAYIATIWNDSLERRGYAGA